MICLMLLNGGSPVNATVMHSQNIGMRFVQANTINLMNSNHDDPPTVIEMYNPDKRSVLVEVFECAG